MWSAAPQAPSSISLIFFPPHQLSSLINSMRARRMLHHHSHCRASPPSTHDTVPPTPPTLHRMFSSHPSPSVVTAHSRPWQDLSFPRAFFLDTPTPALPEEGSPVLRDLFACSSSFFYAPKRGLIFQHAAAAAATSQSVMLRPTCGGCDKPAGGGCYMRLRQRLGRWFCEQPATGANHGSGGCYMRQHRLLQAGRRRLLNVARLLLQASRRHCERLAWVLPMASRDAASSRRRAASGLQLLLPALGSDAATALWLCYQRPPAIYERY
jgi:hypothetical protein